ncbi:LOW QUALITY PROTEIN: hypothetical protein QYF61_003059, partial [Mycteria americana]
MDAKRLRTLGYLERRRLRGNLIALYSFLRRGSADLFSLGSSDRAHGNGSKLRQGRFRLGMGKPFFTESMVRHWNRLQREVVDAPCLVTLHLSQYHVLREGSLKMGEEGEGLW